MNTPLRRLGAVAATAALALAGCSTSDDGATVTTLNSEDQDGSTSGSSSGSASASAPATGSEGPALDDTTGVFDGAYTYASNVAAHRLVVEDVCAIKELLDADPLDLTAVAAVYTEGGASVNSDGSVRTLAGFAAGTDKRHGLDAYHGEPTPLDAFLRRALDGDLSSEDDAVRAQLIEKGIQNGVMVAWTVHELNSALAKAADGDVDPAEGAPHNWDEAWAFYHGAEPGCAPYATADSRGGNFGTMAGETSDANVAIASAMNAGRDALIAGDLAGAQAAADEVLRNIVITYSQAAVRYASLVPGDLEAGDGAKAREHQAEGLAFFRVIEAYVAEAGADVAAVNAVLDLAVEPGTNGGGDEVRAALRPAWASLGIDEATDIGELQ